MEKFRIEKWKSGRSFALYDENGDLICVTLYRRGALKVVRRLEELKRIVERVDNEAEQSFSRD